MNVIYYSVKDFGF